ncbi:MFS transporter [Pseudonocardia bannensis]|uniref:MFS transporter n=1 Tax=Pseudonocardia bannensis TaxID=630973 RepID=A0A848DHB9_9PSEU|nr:MFS transporter [Pseudonocardia bannensis]
MRRHRGYRALWTSRAVSLLGDAMSLVALMLHVAGTTGAALAVALLLLAGDVAPSLLAPLTGALSDRIDLRRLMVVCDLAQAAVVVVIALLLPPLPVLLGLVAVRALLGQVFAPASRAAVPALVDDRDLPSANAGIGFGSNLAEVLGPLLAAALFTGLDVRGVLLVDAATFVVSAVVLTRLPRLPRPVAGTRPAFLADARAGLGYLRAAPFVRAVVLGFCAVVAFNGVDDIALVFLARDLGGEPAAVALLLAGVGAGLLAGYLLLARGGTRWPMVAVFGAGLAISSAGNLLTGPAWSIAAAFTLQVVRGIGIAGMDVAAGTLLQRHVPAAMLGRVFGNLYGALGVAAGLSYVLGGWLLDLTSARTTLVVAGAGGLVAAALTVRTLRRRSAVSG